MRGPKGGITIAFGHGGPPPKAAPMGEAPEGEEEDDYDSEASSASMAAFLDALGIDPAGIDMTAATSAFKDLMEVC